MISVLYGVQKWWDFQSVSRSGLRSRPALSLCLFLLLLSCSLSLLRAVSPHCAALTQKPWGPVWEVQASPAPALGLSHLSPGHPSARCYLQLAHLFPVNTCRPPVLRSAPCVLLLPSRTPWSMPRVQLWGFPACLCFRAPGGILSSDLAGAPRGMCPLVAVPSHVGIH